MKRLISLDAFRGFTIAAMILVNFAGNWDHVYKPLRHTNWWGISFTDLIAPFFLFTVGVSIALAYAKSIDSGQNPKSFHKKIIIRSIKIFMVGMFLNLLGILDDFSLQELRWTGTLHRISLVFLFCALLFLHTKWQVQAILGVVILILYCMAMTMIPTPGYDKVMLEPGINLAAWIDSKFLPGKMWQGTWDPEGILSTFPSFVTGISGMLVGRLLLSKQSIESKTIMLFFGGFVSFSIGVGWSWFFGLNENIWSSSFVMFTSGMASMTLAACIYVIDMLNYQKWAQFGIIYGMNAIAVYVLADILALVFYGMYFGSTSLNTHFFNTITARGVAPETASMLYALIYVGINFIPAWLLYRKKIFIKL